MVFPWKCIVSIENVTFSREIYNFQMTPWRQRTLNNRIRRTNGLVASSLGVNSLGGNILAQRILSCGARIAGGQQFGGQLSGGELFGGQLGVSLNCALSPKAS